MKKFILITCVAFLLGSFTSVAYPSGVGKDKVPKTELSCSADQFVLDNTVNFDVATNEMIAPTIAIEDIVVADVETAKATESYIPGGEFAWCGIVSWKGNCSIFYKNPSPNSRFLWLNAIRQC